MDTHALPEELQHVARRVAYVADLISPIIKITNAAAIEDMSKVI